MEAAHPNPGYQVQRVLWAIGEAHRQRRRGRGASGRSAGAEAVGAATTAEPAGVGPVKGAPAGGDRPRLDLSVAIQGSQARISLLGELDALTAPELLERVMGLADEGARRIVIDLGALEVVDAHGMAALASAATLLLPRPCTLALLGVEEPGKTVPRSLPETGPR